MAPSRDVRWARERKRVMHNSNCIAVADALLERVRVRRRAGRAGRPRNSEVPAACPAQPVSTSAGYRQAGAEMRHSSPQDATRTDSLPPELRHLEERAPSSLDRPA